MAPVFRICPLLRGGSGSLPENFRGPAIVVSLQTSFFIASCGFTHGPPVSLQPGELKMAISRPSRSASAAAWRTASNHSGVPKGILVSTVWPPPAFTSASMNPPMPTRFIHSRSLVMPSLVTLLIVQCHHVRGLAASGGVLNPAASGSPPGCANEEMGAQRAPLR